MTNSFSELLWAWGSLKFRDFDPAAPEADEKVHHFEREFAEVFGDKLHAIIYPHARTALHYILKVFSFERESEVLMTPLTIADMVNSIHLAGLRPRFVDIELETFNFDMAALEAAITPKTRAILVTYIAGIVPNMEKLTALAKQHNLKIIEDCSQAVHASYRGQALGTWGDVAIFSLTNFKVVSALFGGMILTRDGNLAMRLRNFYTTDMLPPNLETLRRHSQKNLLYRFLFNRFVFSYFTYFLILALEYLAPGLTYRLYSGNIKIIFRDFQSRLLETLPPHYLTEFTSVQAELGLASLQRSLSVAKARRTHGELLRQKLSAHRNLQIPSQIPGAENAYWRFPLLTEQVDELKKHLLLHGIDSAKTFLTLCSQEAGFEKYHCSTPRAAQFKKQALILEVDENLSERDIAKTARAIHTFFAKRMLKEEALGTAPSLP